mmetsp:Transcript_163185/g.523384  ORF Transcript_163185/g.523384 Transcript_163185/m.523384 type:complete len:562 (+) Transcript_163185:35-1720(+)
MQASSSACHSIADGLPEQAKVFVLASDGWLYARPTSAQPGDADFLWYKFAEVGSSHKSIAIDKGFLYGVNASHSVDFQELQGAAADHWRPLSAKGRLVCIAAYGGVLYGIGAAQGGDKVYKLIDGVWTVASKGSCRSVTAHDGFLFVVGVDNCQCNPWVYRQPTASLGVDQAWQKAFQAGECTTLVILNHCQLTLGLWDGRVHRRHPTEDDIWSPEPEQGLCSRAIAIAVQDPRADTEGPAFRPEAAEADAGARPTRERKARSAASSAGPWSSTQDACGDDDRAPASPWASFSPSSSSQRPGTGRKGGLGDADRRLRSGATQGSAEIIQEAVGAGANLEGTDSEGKTALHYAARVGAAGAVQLLLSLRANPSSRDSTGGTPVDEAEYWAVKEPRGGDGGALRQGCLAALEVLRAHGGQRCPLHDRTDLQYFQRKRQELEAIAQQRGIPVPWRDDATAAGHAPPVDLHACYRTGPTPAPVRPPLSSVVPPAAAFAPAAATPPPEVAGFEYWDGSVPAAGSVPSAGPAPPAIPLPTPPAARAVSPPLPPPPGTQLARVPGASL